MDMSYKTDLIAIIKGDCFYVLLKGLGNRVKLHRAEANLLQADPDLSLRDHLFPGLSEDFIPVQCDDCARKRSSLPASGQGDFLKESEGSEDDQKEEVRVWGHTVFCLRSQEGDLGSGVPCPGRGSGVHDHQRQLLLQQAELLQNQTQSPGLLGRPFALNTPQLPLPAVLPSKPQHTEETGGAGVYLALQRAVLLLLQYGVWLSSFLFQRRLKVHLQGLP